MWIYFVLFLVNINNIIGRNISPELVVRLKRDVHNTYTSNSMPSYNNLNNRNNMFNSYNDTGYNGYRYSSTVNYNNQYPDYTGNYNYENIPTNYNYYASSTPKYNSVKNDYSNTNYNNSYGNNGMEYNTQPNNNMPVTYPSYNQFPEYNANYNYESSGMYNPFNVTGSNRYSYFNITPTNNMFPGYSVNGTPTYQPTFTIPKHNASGFQFDNFYPISKYDSPTPKSNTNTPSVYNYQDPAQSNFSGYVQDNATNKPEYTTASTSPTTKDPKEEVVVACILCNVGCPANHVRKGIYCVPTDFDYV